MYADLTVDVAINLQPGQRLLIIGPLMNGGVALEAATMVRRIAASAYRAGAELVEAIWGDEALQLVRFHHARKETLGEFSAWLPRALEDHAKAGHAVLSVYANDPDLLQHEPPDLVGALQQATSRAVVPFREHISRNATNWGVVAAASEAWAAKVFPEVPRDQQLSRLWDTIATLCRLDRPDPIAAWKAHLAALAARSEYVNRKRYTALRFAGPGTDLTVGLPAGHIWVSGASVTQSGIRFVANLPTEEVFTIADRNRVEGTVRATKPLSYGGTLIDDFSLRFEGGRVVDFKAARGEAVLRQLVETDAAAGRLGEVALVPHSSPIAQSGLLFYSTLFDENAASHVALGSAYKFTLTGADAMSDAEFEQAGGNRSAIHVDFMIGSGEVDVDGVLDAGLQEPLMRGGEWAREVTSCERS
ncbi:MAG: aminopeptidase [Acidobacteria bacterium 13_1_40CM_65_14]|jgi:aminopeptidase|nr:MAG: aminopeptidase [Acidobacteria bacterium 13_1_40CM_65_14]